VHPGSSIDAGFPRRAFTRRSIVTRSAVLLLVSGLVACGDRPSSQPAASTAQPQTAPQPPTLTGEELTRRTIERRAIEAINWGMPAVNEDLMLQAMIVSAKGGTNQIAYWSRLPDWKIQTLTPNPDVIYLKPFFNTKDAGPMVLEIPPAEGGSITGTIMDAWQAALGCGGPPASEPPQKRVRTPMTNGIVHRALSSLIAARPVPTRAST